ncbi:Na+/H+ antiporter subunit E [Fodinicurvata sp. EGI_FJ10296]|uniref:Na+/H+ antiporter subunit E n=1 Tax=Fodinicurvata sp. EGI_FJ10296 TaxID=3231908 RepID=UPI0034525AE4
MNLAILNILFMLGWALVTGSFSILNLVFGLLVGFLGLWATRPLYGDTDHFTVIPRVIGLILFFLKELLVSSVRVAQDVLTPTPRNRPGIIAIPLEARTDVEITLLGNMISLTPGTLTLEVSHDRQTMYVHAMFLDDIEAAKAEIKGGMERRILEVTR